ncbi:MAG: hypothetical protein M3Z09_16705 [Acidobacteriota bacterium]|nr:hypothetical protein [Acidobacteriota bacterium]
MRHGIFVSLTFFGLVSANAGLNISTQIAAVKDMITAKNYGTAAITIIRLRRTAVAQTKDVPIDFAAIKSASLVATPALVISALDESLQRSYINDLAGTAHALDRAQILTTILDRDLAPEQRFTQQVVKVDQEARNSKAKEASPSALVNAARVSFELGDYSNAIQYCQHLLVDNSRMQGSQYRHWAHTISGLSYFKLGNEPSAVAELSASASVSGLERRFLPSLSLAQVLAVKNPKAVSDYLELVASRNPQWSEHDKVPVWRAILANRQTPDFGRVMFPY